MKFPPWLKKKLPNKDSYFKTKKILKDTGISTVCDEAKCPNRFYCYQKKCATFLILGKYCTRNCQFCDIKHKQAPPLPDAAEAMKVALAAKALNLSHIVITMVTRDDLPDHGVAHIKSVLDKTASKNKNSKIELLCSDLGGDVFLLNTLLQETKIDIFGHNIETTKSLTQIIRNKAKYDLSLNILKEAKKIAPNISTKSGLMVGLGEKKEEIIKTLDDLKKAKVDIVTIGQYLKPSKKCIDIKEYIHPDQFQEFEEYGKQIGFKEIKSAPFVRSSLS